jgi:ABC-type glycerol-3-phosphate transport system substrate-binding protein
VLDLTGLADEDEAFDAADFYVAGLTAMRRQGRLWGLPLTLSLRFVFYDRAAFRRANLPPPSIGWSWDDFTNLALVFTDRQGETVTRYGYEDAMPAYSLPMVAYQKAGRLVNSQALTRTTIARPAVAQALQWYADLALDLGVMPDPSRDPGEAAPRQRAPVMWAGSSFELDTFRRKYGEVGAVPFPEDGEPATGVVVRGAFVSAEAAHPRAAWQWILFLTRQGPSRYHDAIPGRISVSQASGVWRGLDDEATVAYQYGLNHAVHFPAPIYTALSQAYRLILAGEPAGAALEVAQAELARALEDAVDGAVRESR